MSEPVAWNSFQTDAAGGVFAEVITFPGGGGDDIHAYVARPVGQDTTPGIVVVHHLPGWDEWTCEVARKFATL